MMVTQFFSGGGFESLVAGAMANLDEQVIAIHCCHCHCNDIHHCHCYHCDDIHHFPCRLCKALVKLPEKTFSWNWEISTRSWKTLT